MATESSLLHTLKQGGPLARAELTPWALSPHFPSQITHSSKGRKTNSDNSVRGPSWREVLHMADWGKNSVLFSPISTFFFPLAFGLNLKSMRKRLSIHGDSPASTYLFPLIASNPESFLGCFYKITNGSFSFCANNTSKWAITVHRLSQLNNLSVSKTEN